MKTYGEAPENAGRFVIREKKITLRRSLIASGFERTSSSHDSGDGEYEEFWSNGVD